MCVGLLVALLCVWCLVWVRCTGRADGKRMDRVGVVIPEGLLQEGDLVFRRGYGLESDLVVFLDRSGAYSHIGIVVRDSLRGWQVVHAIFGESDVDEKAGNEANRKEDREAGGAADRGADGERSAGLSIDLKHVRDCVKMEDIALFFRGDRAQSGAVMRLKGEERRLERVAVRAKRLCEGQILFDHSYDLQDTTEMYCTELVDFVFRREGLILYKEVVDKKYLLPGDVLRNKDLEEIFSF